MALDGRHRWIARQVGARKSRTWLLATQKLFECLLTHMCVWHSCVMSMAWPTTLLRRPSCAFESGSGILLYVSHACERAVHDPQICQCRKRLQSVSGLFEPHGPSTLTWFYQVCSHSWFCICLQVSSVTHQYHLGHEELGSDYLKAVPVPIHVLSAFATSQ